MARSWILTGSPRLRRAWQALSPDGRLATGSAVGLFLTLFVPWYQETGLASAGRGVQAATVSLTGWAAFSWVEGFVVLVAAGVPTLLFLRAERHTFQLPGGDDGLIIGTAGAFTCLLVIWRIFDEQGVTNRGQIATTAGVEWGIFVTLGLAGALAYAGWRIHTTHMPEPPVPHGKPPLPAEQPAAADPEPWPEDEAPRGMRRRGKGAVAAANPRGLGRKHRATWAEPVTWDQPPLTAEPPMRTAAPRLEEPDDGAPQPR